jgi:hypothetical protein
VRTHADGSLAYRYSLASDGTKTTDQYDTAGVIKSESAVHVDGSSDNKTYTAGVLTSEVVKFAAGSADTFDIKTYSGGVLTHSILHANGSKDVYDTGITGQSYVADHFIFDASGKASVADLTNTNGSHTITAYGSGLTLTSTAGVADKLVSASAGGDNFVFHAGSGNDTITNFHAGNARGHDTITIDDSIVSDFSHLVFQQVNNDTLVKLTANDTILIKNVLPSALTTADFQFAHHDWVLT